MDSSQTPVTRGALERVLARAAELQTAGGDAIETGELTEAQLIDLGQEVGLSPEHLRQALAEERARGEPVATDPIGVTDKLFGVSQVVAQRVVPGRPEPTMAALDLWMQNEEWLRVVRQQPDRMVWEPRRDLLGGLRRAFGGRAYALHVATGISATVVAVDAERTLVVLGADLAGMRRAMVGQTTAGLAVGAAISGALAVLGFMTVVAALPVTVITAASFFGARRGQARALQRAHLALEQVLDRLEQRRGESRPPSLLRMIESALPRPL